MCKKSWKMSILKASGWKSRESEEARPPLE